MSNVVKEQNRGIKAREKYNQNPKHCKECNVRLPFKQRMNDFCSRECAQTFLSRKRIQNGWIMTEDHKEKIANTLRNKPRKKYTNICEACGKEYTHNDSQKARNKTCSKICARDLMSINASVGVLKRSSIQYLNPFTNKNVVLQSSWEVEVADWLGDNDIVWIRPKAVPWVDSKGKTHRYYADFYLPEHDLYIDPKNPWVIKLHQEKIDQLEKKINLVYGNVQEVIAGIQAALPK